MDRITLQRQRHDFLIATQALLIAFLILYPFASSAQITRLRVGTNAPASTESVLFSMAKDAGILKQNQLEVEVIYIAGGTLAMQALVGKSLDFLCTGGTPFILAYLEGAKARIIAGVNNRLPYAFVANGSITTPGQLKGKRIGISRFGSTDDYSLKLALAQFAINPKEVTILQIGGPGTRLNALRAGSIDATVLTSGLAQIAMKSGNSLLIDFGEKNIEYQQVALISRDDLLKSAPELVRRFTKTYLEAIRYYKKQRDVAIQRTMALLKTDDREIAQFDYTLRSRALPDDGRPTVKGLQVALDDIVKDNPRAKGVAVPQFVDLSFLP